MKRLMGWTLTAMLLAACGHHHESQALKAQLAEMQTAVQLSAENTQRYQNTYSDMYFELNSLTVANFEQRVAAGETVYVYIGRPSCGDCNAFEPVLKRYIAQQGLHNKIWFVNVHRLHQDKTAWAAFKQRYGISGTPVLAKYSGGKLQNKWDFEDKGGLKEADLQEWLRLNRL